MKQQVTVFNYDAGEQTFTDVHDVGIIGDNVLRIETPDAVVLINPSQWATSLTELVEDTADHGEDCLHCRARKEHRHV